MLLAILLMVNSVSGAYIKAIGDHLENVTSIAQTNHCPLPIFYCVTTLLRSDASCHYFGDSFGFWSLHQGNLRPS
jgi:hypothetical protein